MFVDIMSSVLSSKISALEDSFRPLIDVLDPNKAPSTDKVEKLATVFPDDILDPDALFAEIEVFFSHCDKEKAERRTVYLERCSCLCNRMSLKAQAVSKCYKGISLAPYLSTISLQK